MAPANGTVEIVSAGRLKYGISAFQSCDGGFSHSGNSTITCQAKGMWSESVICTLVGNLFVCNVIPAIKSEDVL